MNLDMIKQIPPYIFLVKAENVRVVVDYYIHYIKELEASGNPEDTHPLVTMSFDTETTGLDKKRDYISMFSFYLDIPLNIPSLALPAPDRPDHDTAAFTCIGPTLGQEGVDSLNAVIPLLEHPRIRKVGSNINGYDYHLLRQHDIEMVDPIEDTAIMSWIYDENRKGRHGLKTCMLDLYKYKMQDYKDASGSGEMDIRKWPIAAAVDYPALDAFAGFAVWRALRDRLEKEVMGHGQVTGYRMYTGFYLPIQAVIRRMCANGIRVDVDYLEQIGPEIDKNIKELETWMNTRWAQEQTKKGVIYKSKKEEETDRERKAKGLPPKVTSIRPFKAGSSNYIRYMLFDLLGHEPVKMTKPNAQGLQSASTDKDVLQELVEVEGCEFSEKLLEFRKLNKTYGTYIGDVPDPAVEDSLKYDERKGLRQRIYKERAYTDFRVGPVTGRLASRQPNLMNIPSRGDMGSLLRRAFIPSDGHQLIVADYKQLEMRLFAHFANERDMINAILTGEDLHCRTASLMFSDKCTYEQLFTAKQISDGEVKASDMPEDFAKELVSLRSISKAIGFGLLYGMGPGRLAKTIGRTLEEAKQYIERFFQAYPGAKKWIDSTHSDCTKYGKVWTYYGRPRRLVEIFSDIKWMKKRAQRQSVNSIIQGSAADFVLKAMIRLNADQRLRELNVEPLLQVHDELVLECPADCVDEAMALVKSGMEFPVSSRLRVPLDVSIHSGSSWEEAK